MRSRPCGGGRGRGSVVDVKVSAHVEDDDETSRELAATLLAPLASWRTPPAKGRKAEEPASDESDEPTDAG